MYGKVGCSDIAQELGSIICPILSGRCRLHKLYFFSGWNWVSCIHRQMHGKVGCSDIVQQLGSIICPVLSGRCRSHKLYLFRAGGGWNQVSYSHRQMHGKVSYYTGLGNIKISCSIGQVKFI